MNRPIFKDVTGLWRGTYSYDPHENVADMAPVPFTLDLKQGWFGRFRGTVTDHGENGMPGIGMIRGRFSFPRFRFIKQMPVSYCVSAVGRSVSLRNYLTELGYSCDHDLPHPPIYYEGEFLSPCKAQGTWIIQAETVFVEGFGDLPIPETRGTWMLEAS